MNIKTEYPSFTGWLPPHWWAWDDDAPLFNRIMGYSIRSREDAIADLKAKLESRPSEYSQMEKK